MKGFTRRAGMAAAGAVAVALVTVTTVAASTTFNSSTGTGFVGKGDVQSVFGWKNLVAQTEIASKNLSFVYNTAESYTAVCQWTTGDGTPGQKTHDITIPVQTSVNSSVVYDARTHNQIDGINLTGFGVSTPQGTVPVAGDACVGNTAGIDFNGTWVSVTDNGPTGNALLDVYDPSYSALSTNLGATTYGDPNALWVNGVSVY